MTYRKSEVCLKLIVAYEKTNQILPFIRLLCCFVPTGVSFSQLYRASQILHGKDPQITRYATQWPMWAKIVLGILDVGLWRVWKYETGGKASQMCFPFTTDIYSSESHLTESHKLITSCWTKIAESGATHCIGRIGGCLGYQNQVRRCERISFFFFFFS